MEGVLEIRVLIVDLSICLFGSASFQFSVFNSVIRYIETGLLFFERITPFIIVR